MAEYSIRALVVGPLYTNCYIVCKGDECVVIDPGGDADEILGRLRGKRVLGVIATHMHADHIGAAYDIVNAVRASFYVHEADWRLRHEYAEMAFEFGLRPPPLPEDVIFVDEGHELPLGLRVLHTPGHTPGSITIAGPGFLFTGDLLFRRSVGRTDLIGGNYRALKESICRLYREFPPETIVYPGHGSHTTIGEEANLNPFVNKMSCGL